MTLLPALLILHTTTSVIPLLTYAICTCPYVPYPTIRTHMDSIASKLNMFHAQSHPTCAAFQICSFRSPIKRNRALPMFGRQPCNYKSSPYLHLSHSFQTLAHENFLGEDTHVIGHRHYMLSSFLAGTTACCVQCSRTIPTAALAAWSTLPAAG